MNGYAAMEHLEPRFQGVVRPCQVLVHVLRDDGTYPNNEKLPLLAYRGALALPKADPAAVIEALLAAHRWGGSWRNGVYGFHHYHSTAHEVLGVYAGRAEVQFGGQEGTVLTVQQGDVVIIPAGVAHKNLGATPDFRVVGAYPLGQRPDMNYGRPEERPDADRAIAGAALPELDPVYGASGPLSERWHGGSSAR